MGEDENENENENEDEDEDEDEVEESYGDLKLSTENCQLKTVNCKPAAEPRKLKSPFASVVERLVSFFYECSESAKGDLYPEWDAVLCVRHDCPNAQSVRLESRFKWR